MLLLFPHNIQSNHQQQDKKKEYQFKLYFYISALDENKKPGYVRVRVEIPNLKAKGGKGLLSKITGGRRDEAKNAKIDFTAQERYSIQFTC